MVIIFLRYSLITTLKMSSRAIYFPLTNSLKINLLSENKFPDYYAHTPFQCRYQSINGALIHILRAMITPQIKRLKRGLLIFKV